MTMQVTRERAQRLRERERAALRRLGTLMRAEAAELGPHQWVAERLDPATPLRDWGERVLPELSTLMAAGAPESPHPWTRQSSERSPLSEEEEGSLRRLAVLLRAEAAELGPRSPVARRLSGWAIHLALDVERPERPPGLV